MLPELSAFSLVDTPVEFPLAVSSKQVRDVLKSELSTSVPIAAPVVARGRSGHQMGVLHSKEEDAQLPPPADSTLAQDGAAAGNRSESSRPEHAGLLQRA